MIENAFSFVRHAFRCRLNVESYREEAREIIKLFYDYKNQERFKGFQRQYVRNLQDFLRKHQDKNDEREQEMKMIED